MIYKTIYRTPSNFDDILITFDEGVLIGLKFIENEEIDVEKDLDFTEKLFSNIGKTITWLDLYFSGIKADFMPEYRIDNLTNFRKSVMDILKEIPYGSTMSYGDIAHKLKHGAMSSQAVGQAVGFNPICIMIPCHRVIGSDHSIVGYSGGTKNKIELLKLENSLIS